MKTIFHDKESGTKLEMEGTFRNSKAQLVDDEGNVLIESEGSYLEILKMFNQLSGEEDEQLCEDTAADFRGARVKVLEGITDEYNDTLYKGTITTDVTVLSEDNLFIDEVFVETNDFKKLEILTDEQKNIQPDELFVVNNDEMEYYLGFKKGEIVKFLFHREEGLPLMFRNSKGIDQAVEYEDVTRLRNKKGSKLKFDFCYKNNILLTGDTSLEGTKVNLIERSIWIEDDGSLIIHTDGYDGIPYIVSSKSGEGAFVSLENLETRNQDTPSFKIGETVEVKEGRDHLGAVGYAILTDIEEDEIILQGFNEDGDFSRAWYNSIGSIKKVDK